MISGEKMCNTHLTVEGAVLSIKIKVITVGVLNNS